MKLVVPLSYFRGTPRSELWLLDSKTRKNHLWKTLPASTRAVRGKGVTGICLHPDGGYALCDFNRVLHLDANGELVRERCDDEFNDLHAIGQCDSSFLLANTGRDRVEQLDLDFSPIENFDALSKAEFQQRLNGYPAMEDNYYDSAASGLPFCQRRLDDKHHLNYAVCMPDGRIVASSLTGRCYVDSVGFAPIGDRLEQSPHDGFLHQGRLWITTVDGHVLAASVEGRLDFKPVLSLFDVGQRQGWCRGLYIKGSRLFVAITAIESMSHRTDWLTVSAEQTFTGVYEVCLELNEVIFFYDLTHADGSRIFSMTESYSC